MKVVLIAVAGIFLLSMFISVITAVLGPDPQRQPPQTTIQREMAEIAEREEQKKLTEKNEKDQLVYRLCGWAQDAVKAQLKAPATAKFPNCVWSANEYEVRGAPDGKRYWVIGHVDSQNGFGASIRSKFVVEFEHLHPSQPFSVVKVVVE